MATTTAFTGILAVVSSAGDVTPKTVYVPLDKLKDASKARLETAPRDAPVFLYFDGDQDDPLFRDLCELDLASLDKAEKVPTRVCPLVIAHLG